MDQNNNKKKPDQNKNSNWRGFIHLICWAVLLAVLVSYATTYMTSMGHQASSVELEYSEFLDMLDFGKVAGVMMRMDSLLSKSTPATLPKSSMSRNSLYSSSTELAWWPMLVM